MRLMIGKRRVAWVGRGLVILMGLTVFPALSMADHVSSPEATVQALHEFFLGSEMRPVGSPGNRAMEKKVADLFAGSGLTNGAMEFHAPAFVPGPASLSLKGEDPIRLFAMHPTYYRPGNFDSTSFVCRAVYLGRGTYDDLGAVDGTDLSGALAVMEFDSGDAWQRFLRFGVRGFVFLGAERYAQRDAALKVTSSEVAVPRYFVKEADAARKQHRATVVPTGRPEAQQPPGGGSDYTK